MNSAVLLIALIAVLCLIIGEEKVIEIESHIADRIGFIAAKIYIFCKELKGKVF